MKLAIALLALFASTAAAESTAASAVAQAWLKSHRSPTEDQLGELQNSNPAAFAIVNALLKKHASGNGPKLSAEEKGPDVFRRMMTPSHLSMETSQPRVALPYASEEIEQVAAPVAMDQGTQKGSYNPNAAMNRDESSVSRLLSAVAQLGGDKGRKIGLLNERRSQKLGIATENNALEADASLFSEPKPAPSVQAIEEAAAPVEEKPKPHVNSYLKDIDLSGDMPTVLGQTRQQHAAQAESAHHDESADFGSSSLSSFSLDDGAPATPAPKKVEPPKPKKENSFLKWLGFTKKAPAPEEKPVVAAAPVEQEHKNSYLEKFLN